MADDESGPRLGRFALALSIAVVVFIAIAGAVLWLRDAPVVGYGMRAMTMVPTQLSVRPSEVTCPNGASQSPIEFLDTGALADALPVYDGDLIIVRVLVVSGQANGNSIDFAARWPASVVGDNAPVCVFVVGDETMGTTIDWRSAAGGIDVSVLEAPPEAPIQLEMWLVADDPDSGATFRTTLVPQEFDDDVVVDPLGGRISIARRPGFPPAVSVLADPLDPVLRTYDVRATVTNPTARGRALDVIVRLSTEGAGTWLLQSANRDVGACRDGPVVECSLGDLAAGDTVEIHATLTLDPAFAPAAVVCDGAPGDVGFGFCVEADARSLLAPGVAPSAASALVALDRPIPGGLLVGTEPDPLVARRGEPANFVFTLASGSVDLGSVGVVGSDCEEISRELNELLEDGDAFLEVGETWRYRCTVELDSTTTLRIDVAAVDGAGAAVTTSFETTVTVVDPSLTLERGVGEGTVVVTNSGSGRIRDVALVIPACEALAMQGQQTGTLDEGASVEFRCDLGALDVVSAVAYGTDELGLAVIGRFAP